MNRYTRSLLVFMTCVGSCLLSGTLSARTKYLTPNSLAVAGQFYEYVLHTTKHEREVNPHFHNWNEDKADKLGNIVEKAKQIKQSQAMGYGIAGASILSLFGGVYAVCTGSVLMAASSGAATPLSQTLLLPLSIYGANVTAAGLFFTAVGTLGLTSGWQWARDFRQLDTLIEEFNELEPIVRIAT